MGVKDQHYNLIQQYNSYIIKNKKRIDGAKAIYFRKDLKDRRREPYFFIYCSFLDKLNKISKQALTLYLYFGLNMSYKKGYCTSNFEMIARDLGYSYNTIKKWFKELEENKLVTLNESNGEINFFIIPYETGRYCSEYVIQNGYHINRFNTESLIMSYKEWVKTHRMKIEDKCEPFFFLPNKFREYLYGTKRLSFGAIKFYVYCCIVKDKKNGFFFKSLDTMARELNVSKRILSCWITELKQKKLIVRHQLKMDSSSCIHVLPL
ncbi:MAG: helix-turn-helix domain-containing protein [Dehalobacterium sp.]